MGRDTFSETSYRKVAEDIGSGPATEKGEQRHREGKGLDPLVDPKGYGVTRISMGPYEKVKNHWKLLRGVGILEETLFDTTGSMGGNVDLAFSVLPKSYNLYAKGKKPLLARYDIQMITSIFGDVTDAYILCRSQAEMDERIAEQMRLMVPEKAGGDSTEDPLYGIFGAAYLTKSHINLYGLKWYHFLVTDADSRESFSVKNLERVFGPEVLDKVRENGFEIDEKQLPKLKQVVKDLLVNAHAFMLQVGRTSNTKRFWSEIYGEDRIIALPEESTEFLAEVKAAVIGLTEGVLDLQNLKQYLVDAGMKPEDAGKVVKSVSGIPIGAQTALKNFAKIPAAGTLFKEKLDLWPIDAAEIEAGEVGKKKGSKWLS